MNNSSIELNRVRYANLPYLVDGKLRKDHRYRILAEKSFYQKHIQELGLFNPRILDLGCHDGQILRLIVGNRVTKLTGVDILETAVKKARARGIKALVANIDEGLKFEDSSFDIIFAGEIIEHLYNPEKILQDINRVLSKNGALIISVPNICSLRNRARILGGVFPYHYNSSAQERWGDHIRLFTIKSLTSLLEENGFCVNSILTNGLFGSGFAKNIFPSLGDILVIYALKVRDNDK